MGLQDILPELCNMDTTYNNFLSPKAIRAKIDLNSDFDFRKITARFKEVYCILTQQGPKRTGTSLAIAQALLCGDQSLPPAVALAADPDLWLPAVPAVCLAMKIPHT